MIEKVSASQVKQREAREEFTALFRRMGLVVAAAIAYAVHDSQANQEDLVTHIEALGDQLFEFMEGR